MKSKLLFNFPAGQDYSNSFPLGKFASILITGKIAVNTGTFKSFGNIKITRDGDETHNVDLLDLIDFDNMKEGRPLLNIAQGEFQDVVTLCVRLPFQFDGHKGVIRNALDVSKCNDTMLLFSHVQTTTPEDLLGGNIRIYGEPTYHEEVYRPYMLPFSTSATASEQGITITRPNVALLLIHPVDVHDMIEACVNGELIEHIYADDFILGSEEYWGVEEITGDLAWGMINLLPGGLPAELNNRVQVKIIQTTAVSTKMYAFGFQPLNANGNGSCPTC